MKKTIILLMAAILLLTLTAAFAEGTVYWGIDGETLILSAADTGCEIKGDFAADEAYDVNVGRPWHEYNQTVTAIRVDGGAGGVKIADCMDLFYDMARVKDVDLSGLDTSETTSLWCLFDGCSALETADLSMLNTANVQNMRGMFYQCAALESANLSGLDTRNVTDMYAMFAGCAKLKTVDLSSFDLSGVKDAGDMFAGCESLTEVKTGDGWTAQGAPEVDIPKN